jgi:endonuclease/exonuclease/phosphatase family metal-dependent hydrolase
MTVLPGKKRRSSSGKARKRTDSALKKLLYRILLAVNVLLGASLLTAYLAVHINPESFALPAFFGLAYPYLLLANILIIIAWAMLLRYEAVISVVIIAIGLNHFLNYIQLFRKKDDREGTFKVLSYNVRMFNFFEAGKGAGSQKSIMNFLKNQDPDILCLQEFFFSGNVSQVQPVINGATGIKYNSHVRMLGNGKDRIYGIATFTKFPIIRKGEVVYPRSSSLTTFTDVIISRDTFRIYNNHLESFRLRNMERSFIDEIISSVRGETLSEVRNLSARLKTGFISRARQAKVLKDHIRNSPYPVIITGDFNDTPVSYVYGKLRKGLNDSFVHSGYGAGFTYRGYYPANRIDYILFDDALKSSSFEITKVRYSDHYPVTAWFRKSD